MELIALSLLFTSALQRKHELPFILTHILLIIFSGILTKHFTF